jgi:hypothetical protein
MFQQAAGWTETVYNSVWYADMSFSPDTSTCRCIYIHYPLENAVYAVTFLTQKCRMQYSHGPGVRQ